MDPRLKWHERLSAKMLLAILPPFLFTAGVSIAVSQQKLFTLHDLGFQEKLEAQANLVSRAFDDFHRELSASAQRMAADKAVVESTVEEDRIWQKTAFRDATHRERPRYAFLVSPEPPHELILRGHNPGASGRLGGEHWGRLVENLLRAPDSGRLVYEEVPAELQRMEFAGQLSKEDEDTLVRELVAFTLAPVVSVGETKALVVIGHGLHGTSSISKRIDESLGYWKGTPDSQGTGLVFGPSRYLMRGILAGEDVPLPGIGALGGKEGTGVLGGKEPLRTSRGTISVTSRRISGAGATAPLLHIALSHKDYENTERSLTLELLAATGLTMALGACASILFLRRVLKPVHELLGLSSLIAKGQYGARSRTEKTDELGLLGSRFNMMVESVERNIRKLHVLDVMSKDLAIVKDRTALGSGYLKALSQLVDYQDVAIYVLSEQGDCYVKVAHLGAGGAWKDVIDARREDLTPGVLERSAHFEGRSIIHFLGRYAETLGFCVLPKGIEEGQDPDQMPTSYVGSLSATAAVTLMNIILVEETSRKAADSARTRAEMDAARVVQEALLSSKEESEKIPFLDVGVWNRTAQETGGDWYGMHYDPQNKRAYIFIGDVTGHGIPSAIMTGVACGAVLGGQRRAELLQQRIYNHFSEHFSNLGLTSLLDSQHFPKNDPTFQLEELANSLHETFMKTGARSSRLMTMLFLSLDVATGELTYLNAGHNPFYLLSRGEVKAVISGGSIIGFRRERAPSFASRKLMLAPGDAIFVHTDGLVENTGSNQLDVLSPKKLKAKLQSVYTRPVQEIVDGVVSDALALWGDAAQEDDTAIVAFRWLGPHSAKSAEPAPGEPDAPGRAS